MAVASCQTREKILRSALKTFAEAGYAATSVQSIVDAAQVTKPTLYYYFQSKAGLYQALVNWAYDERFRLMQEAARRSSDLRAQLVEVLAALFEFLRQNRDLMRIAFATAFAAPREIPPEIRYLHKSKRNFDFIEGLVKQGRSRGTLNRDFNSAELALGIYGLLNIQVMAHLLQPRQNPLSRRTAERIVKLYLDGARA